MDYVEQMNSSLGMNGMLNICMALICIGFSWWALQELQLERILKRPRGMQAKLLQILLSIALGYQVAKFIIDYFHWSTWIPGMF
ncbi:conserved hypothetical integral membrane protein [Paenibacillus sp. 1_12]|uniref:DUF1146 family protein n=1 Tax=Paenibacillus sp. 1_12 TaxID=1566278 RepID=UPI0008E1D738|nr:DUF1146 family protein [Paenibacillus sp. 1_12]SFL88325.1 conserved hypothetical integral membrane protein [Paenibacillus sp. 1_12]